MRPMIRFRDEYVVNAEFVDRMEAALERLHKIDRESINSLEEANGLARLCEMHGLNVSMPMVESACEYLDELERAAELAKTRIPVDLERRLLLGRRSKGREAFHAQYATAHQWAFWALNQSVIHAESAMYASFTEGVPFVEALEQEPDISFPSPSELDVETADAMLLATKHDAVTAPTQSTEAVPSGNSGNGKKKLRFPNIGWIDDPDVRDLYNYLQVHQNSDKSERKLCEEFGAENGLGDKLTESLRKRMQKARKRKLECEDA